MVRLHHWHPWQALPAVQYKKVLRQCVDCSLKKIALSTFVKMTSMTSLTFKMNCEDIGILVLHVFFFCIRSYLHLSSVSFAPG